MMKIKKEKEHLLEIGLFLVLTVFFIVFVMAAPTWVVGSYNVNYSTQEGEVYHHNLSKNISGFNNDILFSISTDFNITWINSVGTLSMVSKNDIQSWLSILNSSIGNLSINATYNNQTGFFSVPILAANTSESGGTTEYFEFIINATNDAPNFSLSTEYNTSALSSLNSPFNISLIGSDEELQYPLTYNVSFNSSGNCRIAPWSSRNASANCSLAYTIISISNTTSILALTNLTSDQAGIYNLTICVQDDVNATVLPLFRSTDYAQNKTTCRNTTLNVNYAYTINASSCDGLSKIDSNYLNCSINVTTKVYQDSFNFSSNAYLNGVSNDYIPSLSGINWFFTTKTNISSNFLQTLYVNISLNKSYVGNWTVNLTARSNTNLSDSYSVNITFFVNRTSNSVPDLTLGLPASNTTSVSYPTYIYLNVSDNDFLIPDKGVYNETVIVSPRIFNASNLSQEVYWQNFSNLTFAYQSRNLSQKSIYFVPNSSQAGEWTINFTFIDNSSERSFKVFNLTVLDNTAPIWSAENYTFNCVVNSTRATTTVCLGIVNLTNSSYATDLQGDSLSFILAGNNSTLMVVPNGEGYYPQGFNLTSSGIINFIPWKQDVSLNLSNKLWIFNITANDGYLSSNVTFIFNITNINSAPYIQNLSYPTETSESNSTIISFYIADDDFLISSGRVAPSINLSIQNTSVVFENINFSFVPQDYEAVNGYFYNVSFTPIKNNSGNYTINISISDNSGGTNFTAFNLSIIAINNPPTFDAITSNFYSAVNRTIYYNINVTDIESGVDSSGNFTFNYSLITGDGLKTDRIFDAHLNSTSGVLNITFNDSENGKYYLNLSVNDSGYAGGDNKLSYQSFYIYVYNPPNITFPYSNMQYNLTENVSSSFNFTVNHTIGDNLVYELWIDNVSCNYQSTANCNYSNLAFLENLSGYGNGTNVSWSYRPNFKDETYGLVKNLTLVVYPANLNLTDANLINQTRNIKLNISHTNSPLEFIQNISSQAAVDTSTISLNLSNYFRDYDNLDSYYNQTINFSFISESNPSFIVSSLEGWNLILSVPSNVLSTTETVNVWSREYNSSAGLITNLSSNSFSILFTEPVINETTTPQSSSGGGTTIRRASLKINLPEDLILEKRKSINSSFGLENDGDLDLKDIKVKGKVYFNGTLAKNVDIKEAEKLAIVNSLAIRSKVSVPFEIIVNDFKPGRYKITFSANVSYPIIYEENSFYLDLLDYSEALSRDDLFIFTDKLVSENPQCLELRELLTDAENLYKSGKVDEARKKSEKVLESCKNAITKNEQLSLIKEALVRPVVISGVGLVLALALFALFYLYKRVKFNKGKNHDYV